jgi:hypothetical protein
MKIKDKIKFDFDFNILANFSKENDYFRSFTNNLKKPFSKSANPTSIKQISISL